MIVVLELHMFWPFFYSTNSIFTCRFRIATLHGERYRTGVPRIFTRSLSRSWPRRFIPGNLRSRVERMGGIVAIMLHLCQTHVCWNAKKDHMNHSQTGCGRFAVHMTSGAAKSLGSRTYRPWHRGSKELTCLQWQFRCACLVTWRGKEEFVWQSSGYLVANLSIKICVYIYMQNCM